MSCISSECVRRQVAGLHALLPRLISLSDNSTLIPDATMADKWKALLKRVPDLPVGACMQGPHRGMHIVLLLLLLLLLLVLVLVAAAAAVVAATGAVGVGCGSSCWCWCCCWWWW